MVNKYIKRKILSYLNNNINKVDSSIKNDFFRLILRPDIYIPYLFFNFIKIHYFGESNFFNLKKFKILVDSFDSYILSKHGLLFGLWEFKLTKFFLEKLKKYDIFYDVGANLGYYTFLSSLLCKEVHSFEPVKLYFNLLRGNFKKYKNIKINNFGVHSKCTFGSINFNSGKSNTFEIKDILKNKNEIIKLITLDKYIEANEAPTIVKIDIEGNELNALQGARNLLSKYKPLLSVEIMKKNIILGYKIIEFLKKFNYQIYSINMKGNLKKINNLELYFLEKKCLSVDNFIFISH